MRKNFKTAASWYLVGDSIMPEKLMNLAVVFYSVFVALHVSTF